MFIVKQKTSHKEAIPKLHPQINIESMRALRTERRENVQTSLKRAKFCGRTLYELLNYADVPWKSEQPVRKFERILEK